MKKILKLFMVFALVFCFAFVSVNAQTEPDPDPVSVEIVPVVTVKGNNNSLVLTWEADPNAIKYVVQRSTNSEKGFKTIATVVTNTHVDKKLTYGTKYYYRVRACDAAKCTAYSTVVGKKVVPNKVMDVTAKPYSTKVKLYWTATTNNGYYIYSSTDGKTYKKVATIKDRDTVAYKVKGLKSNKLYYFYVVAYQKVGKKIVTGYKSDVISIKTAPAAPAVKLSVIIYMNLE